MSSDGRSRRRELVDEAYDLQVKAGLMASRIPLSDIIPTFLVSPLSLCDLLVRSRDLLFMLFFIHISSINQLKTHDRAQRNMAHLVSARRFSRTVPGPLSGQFLPTVLRNQNGFF